MCPSCGFDVHIDDSQAPPYAFTMECPRCRKSVTMTPPAKAEATLKGDATIARTNVMSSPNAGKAAGGTPANFQETMMAFMQMMTGGAAGPAVAQKGTGVDPSKMGFAWARKNMLVCCADQNQRQVIEQVMGNSRYDMHIAQSSAQALEIFQDVKVDMLVLDPQFDAARQGGITVLRHVSSLMPKYRRRVYIVLVSPQVKTLDTYMAFLNCVNLTVNSDDLESLPAILEKSLKDFNELYRPYFESGGGVPL
jgi:CheY-like chemotaxis protein